MSNIHRDAVRDMSFPFKRKLSRPLLVWLADAAYSKQQAKKYHNGAEEGWLFKDQSWMLAVLDIKREQTLTDCLNELVKVGAIKRKRRKFEHTRTFVDLTWLLERSRPGTKSFLMESGVRLEDSDDVLSDVAPLSEAAKVATVASLNVSTPVASLSEAALDTLSEAASTSSLCRLEGNIVVNRTVQCGSSPVDDDCAPHNNENQHQEQQQKQNSPHQEAAIRLVSAWRDNMIYRITNACPDDSGNVEDFALLLRKCDEDEIRMTLEWLSDISSWWKERIKSSAGFKSAFATINKQYHRYRDKLEAASGKVPPEAAEPDEVEPSCGHRYNLDDDTWTCMLCGESLQVAVKLTAQERDSTETLSAIWQNLSLPYFDDLENGAGVESETMVELLRAHGEQEISGVLVWMALVDKTWAENTRNWWDFKKNYPHLQKGFLEFGGDEPTYKVYEQWRELCSEEAQK